MVKLREVFARTVVDIDSARILKSSFDFVEFINESDLLCWLALERGDVVPGIYIRTIDEALTGLSAELSGMYQKAYQGAAAKFQEGVFRGAD